MQKEFFKRSIFYKAFCVRSAKVILPSNLKNPDESMGIQRSSKVKI
jgi:hypothetical protein